VPGRRGRRGRRRPGSGRGPAAVDVVVDPLDATVWAHLPAPAVHPAVAGLRARGFDTAAVNDHRLHVTGWDVRLLRWRLGVLLAGVDTLTAYLDPTADPVGYHHDRRVAGGGPVEAWVVLADVEAALRAATPLPHPTPPRSGPRQPARADQRCGGRRRAADRCPPRPRRALLTALTGQRDSRSC